MRRRDSVHRPALPTRIIARREGRLGSYATGLEPLCGRWLRQAAGAVGLTREHEISLLLCDGPTIARLNRRWRPGQWYGTGATDVLAFPIQDLKPGGSPEPGAVGDIVVALPVARRDARELGSDFNHHLARLLIHGLLHLLGYDHDRAVEARRMKREEIRLATQLGIGLKS